MSVCIVDELEAVNIKHGNGKVHVLARIDLCLKELLLIVVCNAVIDIGERITPHEIDKPLVDEIQCKRMAELVYYDAHTVRIDMQEPVLYFVYAVSEDKISECEIGFMQRHESIQVILPFRIISRYQLLRTEYVLFEACSVFI